MSGVILTSTSYRQHETFGLGIGQKRYTEDGLRLDALHYSHRILLPILQLNLHIEDLRTQSLSFHRKTRMILPPDAKKKISAYAGRRTGSRRTSF